MSACMLTLGGQLEQDFEVATNEYDYINTAMKNDLPRFMMLAVQFIDPLYHSFYYMQYVPVIIFSVCLYRAYLILG